MPAMTTNHQEPRTRNPPILMETTMTTTRGCAIGWAGTILIFLCLAGCQTGWNASVSGHKRVGQEELGKANPTSSLYGGQKTCPVTGDELDSMGPPVAITVKGERIFVCCEGCTAKVKGDPDLYLAKVMAERRAP